jgi:phosphoserine aminotransferase
MKPTVKPANPNFSSGPCSKRPGYDVQNLSLETLGRSHRSALGKAVLGRACNDTAELLYRGRGNGSVVIAGSASR